MADFHYNFIKKNYGHQVSLCMTDTDSFVYHFEGVNPYEMMRDHLEQFDTSDYPTNHPLHSNKNKKKLYKMKDEMNGVPISEFCGLRSKMYSLQYGDKEKKTAKGIAYYVTRKHLTHEMYKQTLFNTTMTLSSMNSIRCIDHRLQTQTITKISLCPFDNKRYVLNDGVTTLAFGHFSIPQ